MNTLAHIKKHYTALDADTLHNMQLAKAFYLKGITSILNNGMLVEALSNVNLEVIALDLCTKYTKLDMITWEAKMLGKAEGRKYPR